MVKISKFTWVQSCSQIYKPYWILPITPLMSIMKEKKIQVQDPVLEQMCVYLGIEWRTHTCSSIFPLPFQLEIWNADAEAPVRLLDMLWREREWPHWGLGTKSELDWRLFKASVIFYILYHSFSPLHPKGPSSRFFRWLTVSWNHFLHPKMNCIPLSSGLVSSKFLLPLSWFSLGLWRLQGQSSRWNFRCGDRSKWELSERREQAASLRSPTCGLTSCIPSMPCLSILLPFSHFYRGTWLKVEE